MVQILEDRELTCEYLPPGRGADGRYVSVFTDAASHILVDARINQNFNLCWFVCEFNKSLLHAQQTDGFGM